MRIEYILIIFLLLSPLFIPVINFEAPALNGNTSRKIITLQTNLTITGTVIWQDTTNITDENIVIKDGTLILKNVTLIFNATNPAIYIEDNGKLLADNCTIKVYNPSSQKFVIIQTGVNSELWINGTKITNGGRCIDICGAIFIYNGNATINNTVISDSRGIVIYGAKNVTIENTILENYYATAIYIKDSTNVTVKAISITNPAAYSTYNQGIYAINSDNLTIVGNRILNVSYMLNLTKEQFAHLTFENNLMYDGTSYQPVELIFNRTNVNIDYNRPEFIVAYSENVSAIGVKATFYIVGSRNITIINATAEWADVAFAAINVTKLKIYHNFVNNTGYALIINDVSDYQIYLNTFGICGEYVSDDGAYVYDNGYYGNYWKFRPGADSNGDGINDNAVILDADSIDRYPLNASQFEQDTLPPRVFYITPENNSYHNTPSITFELDIVDEWSGLSEILYSVDNGDYVSIQLNKSFTISLSEGEHKISVKAIDKVGNFAVSSITIIVDFQSPYISIKTPANNSYYRETNFLLTWESSDNIALDRYDIYFDGYKLGSLPPEDKDYYFDYVSEGHHVISVIAYDKAGNYNSEKLFITVDVTPPKLSLLSPANGTYTNSSTVTLIFKYIDEYSPFAKIEYSINGSAWTSKLSLSITISMSIEGKYIIRVKVYDYAGNVGETVVVINYDKTPPKVSIKSPKDNETYFEGGIIISWSAEDPAGIAYYELYINGDLIGKFDSSVTIYYTSLKEGNYTITIVAYDNAGNSAKISVNIKVIKAEELIKEEKEKPIVDIPIWAAYLMLASGVGLIAFSLLYKFFLASYLEKRKSVKFTEETAEVEE